MVGQHTREQPHMQCLRPLHYEGQQSASRLVAAPARATHPLHGLREVRVLAPVCQRHRPSALRLLAKYARHLRLGDVHEHLVAQVFRVWESRLAQIGVPAHERLLHNARKSVSHNVAEHTTQALARRTRARVRAHLEDAP